ncbi:MAG: beta-N-acetylhexosaminidase, partial [Planctomycetes bacterium]|nr:beta-N-acetylhexosaminidase [Planctomycetota bacterium]
MTATDRATVDLLDLIPRPAEVAHHDGRFVVDAQTVIRANRDGEHTARALAAALEPACGYQLRVGSLADSAPAKRIDLRLGVIAGGDEAYELTITSKGVEAVANATAGLVLACQTLRQLLPAAALGGGKVGAAWSLPCLTIRDRPAFAWRGMMLDLARHFMPVGFIERMIDLLALYKMNRLHLHLTDSQAWTMEIAAYPRLTQANHLAPAGQPARGTYAQRELRALVAYAAERNVVLVPEIEFPCHSDAALDAYPELLCVNHPARVGGPMDHKEYCAGRDDVVDFVRTVLREVTAVFPSPWIHIGGDEYYGTAWERCPDCQRRLRDEHLEDEDTPELRALFANAQGSPSKHLLYRSFMRRIAAEVVALGRAPILWDDLSWRGTFPPGSALMQWHYRGLFDWMQKAFTPEDPAADAAHAGHAAIAAPASHLYFDYFHGAALLRRLYAFDPLPADLDPARAPLILG